jgi:glutathione-specific gamma-glutamylcyclotransferase
MGRCGTLAVVDGARGIPEARHLAREVDMGEFWVFGYGSLMWRPGFDYLRALPARLGGYHRALCVVSHTHRGTPERPGLVLGLDRGGRCRGVAFQIDPAAVDATMAYLRERELISHVYKELTLPVTLAEPGGAPGRKVPAICYVVDRTHRQYAGKRDRGEILALVRQGVGKSGANRDYVTATQEHLEGMGIHDTTLAWVTRELSRA